MISTAPARTRAGRGVPRRALRASLSSRESSADRAPSPADRRSARQKARDRWEATVADAAWWFGAPSALHGAQSSCSGSSRRSPYQRARRLRLLINVVPRYARCPNSRRTSQPECVRSVRLDVVTDSRSMTNRPVRPNARLKAISSAANASRPPRVEGHREQKRRSGSRHRRERRVEHRKQQARQRERGRRKRPRPPRTAPAERRS